MCSEMSIQWSTMDAGQPQVRWGTEAGHYRASSRGSSVTYTREDLCDAPATTTGWIDPGFTQNAVMNGLQPSTRYFYSYGDEVGQLFLDLIHFACPSDPQDCLGPVSPAALA